MFAGRGLAAALLSAILVGLTAGAHAAGHAPLHLKTPWGLAVDRHGNVYVANVGSNRVVELSPHGKVLRQWGSKGTGFGQFAGPFYVAFTPQGDLFVSDLGNNRVQKFTPKGAFEAQWPCPIHPHTFQCTGYAGVGILRQPAGLAVDPGGILYVASPKDAQVEAYTPQGALQFTLPDPNNTHPIDVALDSRGNEYTLDYGTGHVRAIDSSNKPVAEWKAIPAGVLGGIAVDGHGKVYVTDGKDDVVRVFTGTGSLIASWGSKGKGRDGFRSPEDVALDVRGNVYISDAGNNRIVKRSPQGRVLAVWK